LAGSGGQEILLVRLGEVMSRKEPEFYLVGNVDNKAGYTYDVASIMFHCKCGLTTGFEWDDVEKAGELAPTIRCIWCGNELCEIVHASLIPKQYIIYRAE
jgi:hypothetical protein